MKCDCFIIVNFRILVVKLRKNVTVCLSRFVIELKLLIRVVLCMCVSWQKKWVELRIFVIWIYQWWNSRRNFFTVCFNKYSIACDIIFISKCDAFQVSKTGCAVSYVRVYVYSNKLIWKSHQEYKSKTTSVAAVLA